MSEQGQEVARHRLLLGKQERSIQAELYRGLTPCKPGHEPVAAAIPAEANKAAAPLFWDAPIVEVRSLSVYEQLVQEVS